MKYLTLRRLEKMGACHEALKVFKEKYGKRTLMKEVIKYFDETGREDWLVWLLTQEPKLTRAFIENGADVHASDDAALRWAAREGHLEVVKFLIENEANVHASNDAALCWAAREGHSKVVKFLIEKGADVHASDDAALRWARILGHTEMTEFLEQAC